MCTVTYFPTSQSSFVLTQSRDEHYSRPHALPPQQYEANGRKLIYPKDPTGGGTWMCATEKRTICLLNGAYGPHIFCPPYIKSRGLVLLDAIEFKSPDEFAAKYDFTGIEPFTMIWLEPKLEDSRAFRGTWHRWDVNELVWDGDTMHHHHLTGGTPYIWSASSLYNQQMKSKRGDWFVTWIKQQIKKFPDDLIRFHKEAGDGDKRTNVLMNRGDIISTVSISSVLISDNQKSFYYQDINSKAEVTIEF